MLIPVCVAELPHAKSVVVVVVVVVGLVVVIKMVVVVVRVLCGVVLWLWGAAFPDTSGASREVVVARID